jgi:hypothetical protein
MTETVQTAPSTDLALRREAELGLYNPDLDFRKLLADAGESAFWSQGFRLVSKDDLLGVPFIIISLTYREGFPRAGVKGDYVSVEAVVADAGILHSRPVLSGIGREHGETRVPDPGDLTVYPNEAVVFNDGSTGVRRQVTGYAIAAGIADPGPAGKDVLEPADRQYQKWVKGGDQAADKIVAFPNGEPFRVACRRGLRRSEYANEYGDAVTYYIA